MEHDTKCKKGRFIQESTEVREMFSFANPSQILKAIQVYCGHFYGLMLANLYGEMANQLFRSWSTCV